MKNRRIDRVFAGITAMTVLLCMLAPLIPNVYADGNTVTISNAKEFKEFAKKCTLDEWSEGKTVELTKDIDFGKSGFSTVPTFGGTFNGNGHTLSGIEIEVKGSHYGVFRYVRQTGRISDLNVSAEVKPGGSKNHIGGIAGENSGVIERCSFDGIVEGENTVGGIAGNNTEYGRIVSCTVSGGINGENSTGGIAGKNSGCISDCVNNAAVNTVYEEKETDISDLETDKAAIIESYKNKEDTDKEETLFGNTDTGGIVGYSSGIVQGCVNNGEVGCKHIGYNVGGIAGRQSGYMPGCRNYGTVRGRKDVGGIVGQAEPYMVLSTSENTLSNLKTELNKLDTMVSRFITDCDDLGDETEKRLNGISEYTEKARENADVLIDRGTDFIDDNFDKINAESAILSNTLDKLSPVFDSLEDGGSNAADALESITDALETAELYAPELSDEIDAISSALKRIAKAERGIEKAAASLNRAESDLEDAISFRNGTAAEEALKGISKAIEDIVSGKQSVKKALDEIAEILSSKPDDFESMGINAKLIAEKLKGISADTGKVISALRAIPKNIGTIVVNTEIDFSAFQSAAQYLVEAADGLDDAVYHISAGLRGLGSGLKDFSDEFSEYADDMSDRINKMTDSIAEGTESLSYAAEDIADALGSMREIIDDLANEDTFELVKLGDDFREASDGVFDALTGISEELDGLRGTLSDGGDTISGDLTSLSKQFNLIMNLIIDELEEIQDIDKELSDIILDASDEDIENTRRGKVSDCMNFGEISADRNVGGIVGAMAIEYSKDPEDDVEKPSVLNFTYRTKAVLQSCVNEGKTECKKDCAGGIAGFAEIGTIYKCENYGEAESSDGSYVGGIAGKSESTVRKCFSKGGISGKRYAGGIAGKAKTVTASCSIVTVSGDESIGAVCGDSEDVEKLYHNYYIDKGLGAVDGISYREKAEAVSFDELKEMNGIPSRFISFCVTFAADGKTVAVQDIEYGEAVSRIRYPKIPSKKGHFGNWKKPKQETVTEDIRVVCEYKPYITVLSSEEKNDGGKLALALCEGEFTDKAELHITDSTSKPPRGAAGSVKVYDVRLLNTDIKETDTVKIRILNENKDKVTVWRKTDGDWQKIRCSSRGKYVITETVGTTSELCLRYEKKAFGVLWTAAAGAVVAAAAFAVFAIVKKSRRK